MRYNLFYIKDNRTFYERSVQDRSTLRYYLGLIICWKQNWKYVRARRITRKRGATNGEGVILPLSLAKRANSNLIIGNHTSIQVSFQNWRIQKRMEINYKNNFIRVDFRRYKKQNKIIN